MKKFNNIVVGVKCRLIVVGHYAEFLEIEAIVWTLNLYLL